MKNEKNVISLNEISILTEDEKREINKFLSEVHSIIEYILKTKGKQYSILSCIFNCFYEKKSLLLSRQIIYNYILQDITNHKGKMITSFIENGSNTMQVINENNYIKKVSQILSRNKSLVMENNNQFSIDINYIYSHKNLIEKILFDKDEKIFNNSKQKINKNEKNIIKEKEQKEEEKHNFYDEDNYEIEILESEEDESEEREENKDINLNKEINNNYNNQLNMNKDNISFDSDTLKINHLMNDFQQKEELCLNKKRNKERVDELKKINKKNYKKNKEEIDFSNKMDDLILRDEEKFNKIIMDNANSEREILSLIEPGKKLVLLFQDKELISGINKKEILNENKSFIELDLINYRNENNLKEYINMLNDDYSQFQKIIKSLSDYKCSLNEINSNKFLGKISVMNKIISEKEKCSLLIGKITNKLKQIFMEYDYIKKIIKFYGMNKCKFFNKIKEIVSFYSEKEKDIYVNKIIMLMKEELKIAIDISRQENDIITTI